MANLMQVLYGDPTTVAKISKRTLTYQGQTVTLVTWTKSDLVPLGFGTTGLSEPLIPACIVNKNAYESLTDEDSNFYIDVPRKKDNKNVVSVCQWFADNNYSQVMQDFESRQQMFWRLFDHGWGGGPLYRYCAPMGNPRPGWYGFDQVLLDAVNVIAPMFSAPIPAKMEDVEVT